MNLFGGTAPNGGGAPGGGRGPSFLPLEIAISPTTGPVENQEFKIKNKQTNPFHFSLQIQKMKNI